MKQECFAGIYAIILFLILLITSIVRRKKTKLEILQENNTWKDLMDESQYKGLQNMHKIQLNVSTLEIILYSLGLIMGLSLCIIYC